MSETHSKSFDYFDLRVEVDDEGWVTIHFMKAGAEKVSQFTVNWVTFIECVEFAAGHGLGMENPILVPYAETQEAIVENVGAVRSP